ncbi:MULTISPECIES: ketohydroxyglutarate aldolase [Actinokineospora]|uniref:Ketohydroxyglutarate aldolase n=1 Tax=Actinokineospora fastidiosa TaxID=1816 RepID=A0A918LJH2_9PSEU|nr:MULTISPECIES: ketohydroxyglutarate aldolase [Actinokineospora]UVS79007.1 hypothetical protein Actkin_02748 [Actinokineospora sp. UTMC 2448]GGS55871.1 hypothetical protein GCM10010171_58520 [Actinokineospora fastidiosa]
MSEDPVERVLVVLADSGLARLPEVVAGLEAAGLRVDEVLDSVGVISGAVAVDAVSALAEVDGVEAIEPITTFQLPEPGSDVQ